MGDGGGLGICSCPPWEGHHWASKQQNLAIIRTDLSNWRHTWLKNQLLKGPKPRMFGGAFARLGISGCVNDDTPSGYAIAFRLTLYVQHY